MGILATLTTIPTEFGSGGSGLTPLGASGVPSLKTLLDEYKAALESLDTAISAREGAAVADATALAAIAATARTNGMQVTVLDSDTIWTFDSGSSAGASAWVVVPAAGTGRWIRNHVSLADLSAVTGATLVGSNAAGYIAATVAAQLAEVKAIADAGVGAVKISKTILFSDLTGASTAIDLAPVCPANARIISFERVLNTPFSGGTLGACTLDLGVKGADTDCILDGNDLFTGAAPKSCVPQGIAAFAGVGGATLVATVAGLAGDTYDHITAGSVTVNVFVVPVA